MDVFVEYQPKQYPLYNHNRPDRVTLRPTVYSDLD